MPSHYHQLCPEERACIMQMTAQGHSLRHIARLLRRAPSSICREVRRNACPPSAKMPLLPGAWPGNALASLVNHASFNHIAPHSSLSLNYCAKAGPLSKFKADCGHSTRMSPPVTCPTKPSTPVSMPCHEANCAPTPYPRLLGLCDPWPVGTYR